MSVCAVCRRRGSSLPQSGAGRSVDAVHRIATGGVRVDDAPGEVEGGVLQGRQAYRNLSAYALHVPWFYISIQGGQRQSEPELQQFSSGSECGGPEAYATGGTELAHSSTDTGDACGSGEAIQSGDTRVVELFWGILSDGDAKAHSIHRSEA